MLKEICVKQSKGFGLLDYQKTIFTGLGSLDFPTKNFDRSWIAKSGLCSLTEKKFASTVDSFPIVTNVFGIGLSTTSEICMEFRRIISSLTYNFIKFPPKYHETAIAIHSFQKFPKTIIPNIIGAIDGTRRD